MCRILTTEKNMPLMAELDWVKSKMFHRRKEENSIEWLHIMPDMFTSLSHIIKKNKNRYEASLVVQWLRIASQRRGHRFNIWLRKLPHASEQLSACTASTEACAPRAGALQRENHREEKPPLRRLGTKARSSSRLRNRRKPEGAAETHCRSTQTRQSVCF